VSVTNKEVINIYLNTNPKAVKFYNILSTFLNILQEPFKGVPAIKSNAKLINKAIKSCIDLELFITQSGRI